MVIVLGVYPNLWGFSSAWLSPQLHPPVWHGGFCGMWKCRYYSDERTNTYNYLQSSSMRVTHTIASNYPIMCVYQWVDISIWPKTKTKTVYFVWVYLRMVYISTFSRSNIGNMYEDDEPLFSPQFSIKSILIIHRMISALYPQYIPIIYRPMILDLKPLNLLVSFPIISLSYPLKMVGFP